MGHNYYYIVLLWFKIVIADNDFWPQNVNPFGNFNLENEELKTGSYAPIDSNPTKIYYLGTNHNPTISWENPDYNNVVLNDETEENQNILESKTVGILDDQEKNMYNNYELVESVKNNIFNDLLTFTTHPSASEVPVDRSLTYLRGLLHPSEIETNYIQRKEPEITWDNVTNSEKLTDMKSGVDVPRYATNYEYIRSGVDVPRLSTNYEYTEPRSTDIFSNFIVKLLDNKNKLEPNVRIEAISSQVLPKPVIATGLPKLSLNNLPIISTKVQPSLANIIFKNTPRHLHDSLHPNYVLLPKLVDSLHHNYYVNDLPSKKYTRTREQSIKNLPFYLNRDIH